MICKIQFEKIQQSNVESNHSTVNAMQAIGETGLSENMKIMYIYTYMEVYRNVVCIHVCSVFQSCQVHV